MVTGLLRPALDRAVRSAGYEVTQEALGEGLELPLSRSCGWAWEQIPSGPGGDPDGPGERSRSAWGEVPMGLGTDPRWVLGQIPSGPGE